VTQDTDKSTRPLPEDTIEEAQQELIDEFGFFDDWTEKYQFLIDMGRKLPDFPEEWQREEHRVRGCQSRVWIVPEKQGDRLRFHATSDSAIVSGLLAVLMRVYDGRTPREIVDTSADFIGKIGFTEHLSPMRSNGFHSALEVIKSYARSFVGES
jgi:cysteine desulfuration protein SufE